MSSDLKEPEPAPDGEILREAFPDLHESERPYTRVSYGLDFYQTIKKHVHGFIDVKRAYVLVSKSIATNTDNLKTLEAALGERHAGTWLGIPAHSPYDALIEILHDVKEKRADCIMTLGGGSLADGAKLIVYALENGVETIDDLIALERREPAHDPSNKDGFGSPAKIPLIFVPSTLSGAEYSNWAGCTNPKTHMKTQFVHPSMCAKLVVLDPKLCLTTPDWVWRSTGARSIDHCVESICSSSPRQESDEACSRGLRLMVRSLLAYAQDPDDLKARLDAQIAGNFAMTFLALKVECGALHGIGHNLGPLGVGHGETSCVLLPAVMKYNKRVSAAQQEKVKDLLWSEEPISDVLRKRGLHKNESDLGDALKAVFDELGMPRSLKDVGVSRDQWDKLAENSLADAWTRANPVPLKEPGQVKEILEMCSGDT